MNGCTFAQANTTASQLGRGQHYVYNLSGNAFYLFDVECEPAGGGSQCYAESIPPAPDAQNLFNDYHLVFQQINSAAITSTVNYFVASGNPAGPNGSPLDDGHVNAFDTLYASHFDNALRTYLQTAPIYPGYVGTFLSLLANVPYQINGLTFIATINFYDGSVRKYSFNQATNAFEPMPGTAIDSEHNTLDPVHEGPRLFLFNGPISRPYNPGNVATLLGVSPPALPQRPLTCTWDGVTLHCFHSA